MSVELLTNIEPNRQIKSKTRVRDLAEVYTRFREVDAMLDLVGSITHQIDTRILEPTCGNGNFLVRILSRKLITSWSQAICAGKSGDLIQKDFEFNIIRSVSSIYAVDICDANVAEARSRLIALIQDFYSGTLNTMAPLPGFWNTIRFVVQRNLVHGDMLNNPKSVVFTEYTFPKTYKMRFKVHQLQYMISGIIPNQNSLEPSEGKLLTVWTMPNA